MDFCSPFDAALFHTGPPSVFLSDREGMLRFDETWTRDAWLRTDAPTSGPPVWRLLRDHATGFITLIATTSADLIATHPRADVRAFATREQAQRARDTFGHPPICQEAW